MKKFFIFFVVLIFSIFSGFSEYNRFGIPDSSEIRKNLVETWFMAPLAQVRMNKPEIYTNTIGQKFQVRLEETEDYFSILVAPYSKLKVEVYSDKGRSTEIQDVYLGDSAGGWILVRDKKTEKPIKIVYYFASDSDVFIQFTPYKKSSCADFVIFNSYVAKGVSTGLSFDRFYTAGFSEIQKWTEKKLPWNYTVIYTDGYQNTTAMISQIRKNLTDIVFCEDAMYDENENPVYISSGKSREISIENEGKITLNGAGFLKWMSDGLVVPVAGGALKREPLILETVQYKETGYQGIISENYDISFSLDWIRNLSSAIISVKNGVKYLYNESGCDVQIEPFSAVFTEKGIENIAGFIPNTGYSVKFLKPLLYILAASESDNFYFGAIRETDKTKSPEVKVFNQCAVFFPYFDSDGHFCISVFKDGKEVAFDDFCNIFENDYVFLTRNRSSKEFFPISNLNK